MKKMLNIVLSATLALSLAACGGNQTEAPVGGTSAPQPQVQEPAQSTPEVQQPDVQAPEVQEPQTEEPETPVVWTLDTVPVPEEMREFVSDQSDDFVEYVARGVGYDVLTAYEALLTEKGFTVTQTTLEPQLHQSVATQNNATVQLYYEVADGDLTDPKRVDGGAALDTAIFAITIEVEPVEEAKEPAQSGGVQSAAFDNSWASNEFEQQIARPTFQDWEVMEYNEGVSWSVFIKDLHYDDVKAYADDLRSYGFTGNEVVDDGYDGLAYIFNADNPGGYHAEVIFEAYDLNQMGHIRMELSK